MTETTEPTVGQLMKTYERRHQVYVSKGDYILLRLDGKAFHSYTRGLAKPYDSHLMDAMDRTLHYLCDEIPGVRFGYVESDEISLLITAAPDRLAEDTPSELWMGGRTDKMLSLSAAMATAKFNEIRREQMEELADSEGFNSQTFHRSLALFDSRIWTFPGTEEGRVLVQRYFHWRRRDSIKNSVTMAALDAFGHKALQGVKTEAKQAMLQSAGKPWEELPAGFRFGRQANRVQKEMEVTYRDGRTKELVTTVAQRRVWVMDDAEVFTFHGKNLPHGVDSPKQ